MTLGSGQTKNTQIRVFVYFTFDNFLESNIVFESRFQKRIPIFLFKKIYLKSFGQLLKKSKHRFPIVFSKINLNGVGSFFFNNFYF